MLTSTSCSARDLRLIIPARNSIIMHVPATAPAAGPTLKDAELEEDALLGLQPCAWKSWPLYTTEKAPCSTTEMRVCRAPSDDRATDIASPEEWGARAIIDEEGTPIARSLYAHADKNKGSAVTLPESAQPPLQVNATIAEYTPGDRTRHVPWCSDDVAAGLVQHTHRPESTSYTPESPQTLMRAGEKTATSFSKRLGGENASGCGTGTITLACDR